MAWKDLTPQEQECVRIALDAYQAEMEDGAQMAEFDKMDEAKAKWLAEAAVAQSAREKLRRDSMNPTTVSLTIKVADDSVLNHVYDAVNETLRALAMDGVVEDADDDGWKWSQ